MRTPSPSRAVNATTATISAAEAAASRSVNTLSLAGMAQQQLEDMIVTLQLAPGSLWSEEALSDRVAIGRTPVREAVKRLQADHLVEILPRHGLRIAEINLHDQLLLVEFRRDLELFISSRAALRALAAEREQLVVMAEAIRAATAGGDVVGYLRRVFDTNKFIARIGRNPFAARSISPVHALSRRFYFAYHGELRNLSKVGGLHAERAMAVASGDAAAAREEAIRLMDEIETFTRKIFNMSAGLGCG